MQQLLEHIDGKWWTSNHDRMGHKLQVKMRKGKGCKIHIWDKEGDKVIKTLRFNFSTESYLIEKAVNWLKLKSKQ